MKSLKRFFYREWFLPCSNISRGYGLALRVSDGERLLLIFEAYRGVCEEIHCHTTFSSACYRCS